MLNRFHRFSALVIGVFVLIHLFNHLLVLQGIEQHIEFMQSARVVYRHGVVEGILLFCLIFQIISGLFFVWRRRGKRSGFFDKAQAISGLYLAFFLINHVAAVMYGRYSAGLDTNIYYGIAGFHVSPFYLYFIPYYSLAVIAIFVHLACAFNWLSKDLLATPVRQKLSYTVIFAGGVLAAVLILGFNGNLGEVLIPAEYLELYQ